MAQHVGMVDVSGKDVTLRTAKACGEIVLGDKAFDVARTGSGAKGDVFAAARIAAIQAVKLTPHIIPLCHTVNVEGVDIEFAMNETDKSVIVTATVRSTGKTGVEMEALVAAGAACLTIYDMLKYTGKDMVISEIKLMEKSGGKSGTYKRHD